MSYTNGLDDPSAHFQTTLYTGDGNDDRQVTNGGNSNLKPDLVWVKDRTQSESNAWFDSTRGATVRLQSNTNGVESTETATVKSFTTDGFTVGTSGSVNNGSNPDTYVAWQWKANGGSTSTNSDGDINSTVQVNSDAGFSIVTYSPANNTARNIGHGLGTTPSVVITRARNRAEDWRVFHSGAGSTGSLTLNDTSAHNSSTVLHTGVASTTFGVGTDFSVNGAYNYVSYVFANKKGFSKHGKYTGNGSSNGVFVHTGFKPRWIMVKRSDTSGYHWRIYDTARSAADGFNPLDKRLQANLNEAEGTHASDFDIDALSNGFKLRTSSQINVSGGTYVYMCFAHQPFVTSTGIPTTAR